jgi:hypothetical protein
VNCLIGRVSAEWGCSGRFERAASSHPDSSDGVWGDEVCGKVGRESRRDMESYDTVNGSKSFPHGARLDGYSITTSSIKDGPADYGRVCGITIRTVRRQRWLTPTSNIMPHCSSIPTFRTARSIPSVCAVQALHWVMTASYQKGPCTSLEGL